MTDPITLSFILTVVELTLRYGVPAAMSIISTLQDNEPITLEKIEALKNIKPPEEFFK